MNTYKWTPQQIENTKAVLEDIFRNEVSRRQAQAYLYRASGLSTQETADLMHIGYSMVVDHKGLANNMMNYIWRRIRLKKNIKDYANPYVILESGYASELLDMLNLRQ